MTSAPHLTADEIATELSRILGHRRRVQMVALYGTGEAGEVESNGDIYRVVPTRCELELRAALPEPPAAERPAVFLVDWAEELPLDIRGRLAGVKLYRISDDRRLAARFGAVMTTPGLARGVLARRILAGDLPEITGSAAGQVLQEAELLRWALAGLVGLQVDETRPQESVLRWTVERDSDGPAFRRRCDERWPGLWDELTELVAKHHGRLVHLLWLAWGHSGGRRMLELLLLLEPLLGEWGGSTYAEGLLRGRLPELAAGFHDELLEQVGQLRERDGERVDSLLATVSRDDLRRAMQAVEVFAGQELRSILAGSRWLPAGLDARKQALAAAVTRVVAQPTAQMLAEAVEALAALESHRDVASDAERDGREQMIRLAAYLVTRSPVTHRPASSRRAHRYNEQQESAPGVAHQEAARLARDYRDNGGWVDLARRRLRGWSDPLLGEAAKTVLAAADALRRDDDHRFAVALVAWLNAGRPAGEILPIDWLAKKLVKELLREQDSRKLLVLLMDGMSWANAVELVPTLEDEPHHWRPAAWQPPGHHSASAPLLPPVVAALPTLTEVSRAAFFAGVMRRSHGNEPSSKDPQRWAANRAVATIDGDSPDDEPQLLLKKNLLAPGEGLHRRIKRLIGSERRLVAAVVNVLDEELGGSAQMLTDATVGNVKPLRELLQHAGEAGRAVLLVSDHGHVPGGAMVGGKRGGGGRRYRPLSGDEQAGEGEIELPADHCWRPRGCRRVAAAVDDRLCYGRVEGGAHGGASLAEVVAPALLLVPDNLADDTGLDHVSFPVPEWWQLRGPTTRPAPSLVKARTATTTARPTEPELKRPSLLQPEEPAPPEQARRPAASQAEIPLVRALERSPVFKAYISGRPPDQVAEALRWLAVLLEHDGRMGEEELAHELGVVPGRVGGMASRLGELLNLDGYEVIERSIGGRQVRVDRELLRQLFEIKERG